MITKKNGLVYKINVMGSLRSMAVGDTIEFPNSRVSYYAVHSAMGALKKQLNKRFSVRLTGYGYAIKRLQ